jgi:hypothetical protein
MPKLGEYMDGLKERAFIKIQEQIGIGVSNGK